MYRFSSYSYFIFELQIQYISLIAVVSIICKKKVADKQEMDDSEYNKVADISKDYKWRITLYVN